MLDKSFMKDIGLTEETISVKELNGKFIAVLKKRNKSGGPKMVIIDKEMTVTDEEGNATKFLPGDILAHENPILVQCISGEIYPEFSGINNLNGKHIKICPIPKTLSHF